MVAPRLGSAGLSLSLASVRLPEKKATPAIFVICKSAASSPGDAGDFPTEPAMLRSGVLKSGKSKWQETSRSPKEMIGC